MSNSCPSLGVETRNMPYSYLTSAMAIPAAFCLILISLVMKDLAINR